MEELFGLSKAAKMEFKPSKSRNLVLLSGYLFWLRYMKHSRRVQKKTSQLTRYHINTVLGREGFLHMMVK